MGIVPAHLELTRREAERGSGERLPGLDGLRGIAVLLVMMFHFQLSYAYSVYELPFEAVCRSGWVGVDLFFVLSGFLITRILLEAKGEPHYFRNFYARRAVRILPLYYTYIACLMFVAPLVVGSAHVRKEAATLRGAQWWMWTHTSNWVIALTGDFKTPTTLGTGGCWSLAIEEQYYLVWPLVVLLLPARILLRACLSLAVASAAIRLALALSDASWAMTYAMTFARLDPIALGGALAIVSRSPDVMRRLRALAPRAAVVAGSAFLLIEASRNYVERGATLSMAVQVTLVSVLWPATFVITLMAPPGTLVHSVTHHPFFRTFGKYSYALYLFHPNVAYLMRFNGRIYDYAFKVFGSIIPFQIAHITLCTIISLALAMLSWHLFEKHFLKLKRWFPSHPRETDSDPAPPTPAGREPLVTPAQTPR